MPTIVDSAETWKELMETSKEKPVVVDFYADWCGPCKMIAPIYVKLSEDNPDVVFAKLDVDNDDLEDIVAEVGVSAMPTFKVFKDGKEFSNLTGADPTKLAKLVADSKA